RPRDNLPGVAVQVQVEEMREILRHAVEAEGLAVEEVAQNLAHFLRIVDDQDEPGVRLATIRHWLSRSVPNRAECPRCNDRQRSRRRSACATVCIICVVAQVISQRMTGKSRPLGLEGSGPVAERSDLAGPRAQSD